MGTVKNSHSPKPSFVSVFSCCFSGYYSHRRDKTLKNLLVVLMFGLLFIRLFIIVWRLLEFKAINFRIEFEIVSFSLLLSRGINAYQSLFENVIPIGYYFPLTYLLPALLGNVFGISRSLYSFLLLFRFIAFAYFSGALVVGGVLIKRIGGSVLWVALGMLVLVSKPWCPVGARPDWAPFFYVLLGLCLVHKGILERCVGSFLMGLLSAWIFFHVQRMVGFGMACFLWLAVGKKFKNMFYFCLGGILLSCAIAIPAIFSTKGIIWQHAIFLPSIVSAPGNLFHGIFSQGVGVRFYAVLLFAAFFWFVISRKSRSPWEVFLSLYVLGCTLISLYTLRSPGADTNQLLEWVFAMFLIIVTGVAQNGRFMDFKPKSHINVFVAFALTVVFSYSMASNLLDSKSGLYKSHDYTIDFKDKLLMVPRGPMLSEECIIAYKTGHPEAASEGYYFSQFLFKDPRFNLDGIRKRIHEQYYASLVLAKDSKLLPFIQGQVEACYQATFAIGPYTIWIPKSITRR